MCNCTWGLEIGALEICIINSKRNGTPKGFCLPTELHSILAVANLFEHNNLWICYDGQVNLVR